MSRAYEIGAELAVKHASALSLNTTGMVLGGLGAGGLAAYKADPGQRLGAGIGAGIAGGFVGGAGGHATRILMQNTRATHGAIEALRRAAPGAAERALGRSPEYLDTAFQQLIRKRRATGLGTLAAGGLTAGLVAHQGSTIGNESITPIHRLKRKLGLD
jgi:hypothetical protein